MKNIFNFKLDKWQKEILNSNGNIALRSGRQVGKSTIISMKAGEYAIKNSEKTIMVVAKVERQAQLLFEKILSYIHNKDKKIIKTGKDRPTKHKLQLKNNSTIYCLPVGESGYGIRGYTIDLLIVDEAAFIPEDVWAAITPMLATTGGDIWLLSTPFGRQGYFYESFQDKNYKKFHISTPEVAKIRPKNMKERMMENIEREKKRMTKLQFAQEYLGEFVDELRQFFPDNLIKERMIAPENYTPNYKKFLGVDIARMGGDETVFCSVERKRNGELIMFDCQIFTKMLLTQITTEIIALDKKNNYKRIYIDDGGLGVGVFDSLLDHPQTKRKVEAINNSRRSLDNEEKRRKKLLKEDLYNNLLNLMEREKVSFLNREEIFHSLKSVQYEYTEDGKLKIFGNYTHIAEALIRAVWCVKDKHLNIWIT
ncbi:MAG: terminase large subunit domain-containing protein [Candidatus Heimdallarchaeota archaeon]